MQDAFPRNVRLPRGGWAFADGGQAGVAERGAAPLVVELPAPAYLPAMTIEYLDGGRLRRALVAACDYVGTRRAELNRINVFPVPDGDTGTNLALTVGSIADRLRASDAVDVGRVAREAAEACVLGARGNCGMILSHFLLGFAESVDGGERLTIAEFAAALRDAVGHVYRALERPVEGTMISVMREVAEAAEQSPASDFGELLEILLERARDALARTPELLPVLKAAGVVDAGAKGFVHLLEGVVEYINGDPFVALPRAPVFESVEAAAARAEIGEELERYRFCTEALVRGAALPGEAEVRAHLREAGDSLIVIRTGDLLKLHIHTDVPERVFDWLRSVGTLEAHKAEDMAVQHRAIERAAASHIELARRPLAILSDSACDLPQTSVLAHNIHLVPLTLIVNGEAYRDRADMSAAEFARRLEAGERASTSQPPPAAFLEGYTRAALDGERVVGVLLASALSGTFASAQAAAKRFDGAPVRLVDSRAASILQGLLVLKAAELAEVGRTDEEIAQELPRVRRQSGFFFTVDVFDYLIASGRVGRGRVLLANLFDIKPILELDTEGLVAPVARVRGREKVLPKLLEVLERRVPTSARAVRFGIVHVAAERMVERVAAALRERYGDREIVTAPASPVLATHTGPGAWGLAYLLED